MILFSMNIWQLINWDASVALESELSLADETGIVVGEEARRETASSD